MNRSSVGRFALALMLGVTVILAGCSTAWIAEAEKIVAAMIPAVANLVALVTAFEGKSVSAADLQIVQSAGTQAGADLQLIQSLMAAYQKADAAARPGMLNQIQSAVVAAQGSLTGVLPALHIKDAATQAKVTAVVGILLSEVEALAAVVPVVQGAGAGGQGSAAGLRLADSPFDFAQGRLGRLSPHSVSGRTPLSAGEFVKSYNATLTAKTGNVELDRVTAGLRIHLHGEVARVASVGVLK